MYYNPAIPPDAEFRERDGKTYVLFMDGNMWCAIRPDHVDLQTSPGGFGRTPEEAIEQLDLQEQD